MLSVNTMRQLPLPTPEQHSAFINHLCDAHSWYKHLPLMSGGEFVVYVSPDAGLDYPSQHPRLPYGNSLEGYRQAFGYLDYIWRVDDAVFYRDGSKSIILPPQVVEQCSFTLYPYVAREFYWGVHAAAMTHLRSGNRHPQREALLAWEAAANELERIENEPRQSQRAAILEKQTRTLHNGLRAQEVAKIEQHLRRLYEICNDRCIHKP